MASKSFFKERDKKDIADLKITRASNQRSLVETIQSLDPSTEALELRVQLIPSRFYANTDTGAEASRKALKHGDYLALSQPTTIREALVSKDLPHEIRKRDFKLNEIPESQINLIGYSFRPIQGNDKRKRLVPFSWILEGAKIFSYAESLGTGIEVRAYDEARKVETEGAEIITKVPSRSQGKSRYDIKFKHVPVIDTAHKNAICWGLDTNFSNGLEPEHKTYNIRYTRKDDPQGSDVKVFYPHEVAGYLAIARHYATLGNKTPWDMNPFAKPSQELARFYTFITNNVLISDLTLPGNDKRRKLHIAEECILLGRAIRTLGHDRTLFWGPKRDPKLVNYVWNN